MQRPWGYMVKLLWGRGFWLKFLRVRGRTSLQSHSRRTEWHFGLYRVDPGDVHRMQKGWFVELAVGEPDESDITRYRDDYGRR